MSKGTHYSSIRKRMRTKIIPEASAYTAEKFGSNRNDKRTQKAYENFKRPAYCVKKGEKK